MADLPDYLAPDSPDWRKYVEDWRVTQPGLITQFDRLQNPINGLTATSMDELSRTITTGLDRGYSALQIADGVADESYPGIAGKFSDFEDWRSEMIARTEAREAFNAGSLRSYADGAVDQVEAIDGDFDERCRIRNGERWPFNPDTGEILTQASDLEEHPNGGLTWGPMGSQQSLLRGLAEQDKIERGLADVAQGAVQDVVRYAPTNANYGVFGGRSVSESLRAGEGGTRYRPTPPTKAFQKVLDTVTKQIDSVHGDGQLPDLPVYNTTKGMRTSLGQFRSMRDGSPLDIKIRSASNKDSLSYLTHEIGHFLDNSALRKDGEKWATEDITKGPIAQVFKAIEDSEAFKKDTSLLNEIAAESRAHPYGQGLPREPDGRIIWHPLHSYESFLRYATSNRELWARAYAQYIAEMTGDETMLATIQSEVNLNEVYHGATGADQIAYQWTTADFAPIKDAITQMFVDLGYMEEEGASAAAVAEPVVAKPWVPTPITW